MTIKTVVKGDSYAFGLYLKGITDLTGYTCQMQVRDSNGALQVDKAILATNDSTYGQVFRIVLTPAESSSLTVLETYTMSAQINNASMEYAREETKLIKIKEEHVY